MLYHEATVTVQISALGSIVCYIGSHYLSLLALLSLPTVSL